MTTTNIFITLYRVIKFNATPNAEGGVPPSFQLMFMLLYFSMVKIPLGSVTLRCATASSRLNT